MNDMKQSKTVANKTGSLSPTFCYFEIKKIFYKKFRSYIKKKTLTALLKDYLKVNEVITDDN